MEMVTAMKFAGFLMFSILTKSSFVLAVPHIFEENTPAYASEVNENFESLVQINNTLVLELDALRKEIAPLARFGDPTKYYPNWRYESEFFIELPQLAGTWVGNINDDYNSQITSSARLNFISRYSAAGYIFFGVYLIWSPDITAYVNSGDQFYSWAIRHHDTGSFSSVTYTRDSALDAVYGNTEWQTASSTTIVQSALIAIYGLMEFDSGRTKNCPAINVHLNADYSVAATGSQCTTHE